MEAPPPNDGLNFFVPWGLLQWVLGLMASCGTAVALWVWRLGGQVERANQKIIESDAVVLTLSKEAVRLQEKVGRLESTLAEKMSEAERARVELKEDLLTVIRDLPTRVFIESQMQQLSQRIDGIIDARLHRPARS